MLFRSPNPKTIGICTRVYPDGRKRENLLEKIAEKFLPDDFSFKIMGAGWEKYVEKLLKKGFQVEYTPEFNYDKYIDLIPSLDYYLYMGLDEGQMGFIDALAAGVETIVPPIGYHLDALEGISYPFTSEEELITTLTNLAEKRRKLIKSVQGWTWPDYAKKHLEIWQYLLDGKEKIGRAHV